MINKINYEFKHSYNFFFCCFFFLSSCSPKKNFSHNDLEEIYNFKSKTIALSLVDGKIIKEFLEFENNSIAAKKVFEKCKQYIDLNSSINLVCKNKFIKITNKIETSLN